MSARPTARRAPGAAAALALVLACLGLSACSSGGTQQQAGDSDESRRGRITVGY